MTDLARCLELALREGGSTHSLADVTEALQAGRAQLFAAERGAAVTEILLYPRAKHLRIWLAGGELEALRELLPQVEELARREGCSRLEAIARPGFTREAVANGWRARSILMTKEL